MTEPTGPQIDYVRGMQKKLHLPNAILDSHCQQRFSRPFNRLDRRQTSDLIEEMIGWTALPAALERAKGQLDLFATEDPR